MLKSLQFLLKRPTAAMTLRGIQESLPIVQRTVMDTFSEILSGVKLHGALFFNADFSAPWGFAAPPSRTLVPALAPDAAHLVIYHFVMQGGAVARTVEGQTVTLESGDVVVVPQGDPHFITSGAGSTNTQQTSAVVNKVMSHDFSILRAGGGGETTRFVCGFMACDTHLGRPILNSLPPIFKVNIRADASGHWLESCILHLVDEAASGRVGSDAMLAKLSEALFVDTLRRYVATLPDEETGWLAGARDPIVGKSLGLMHRRVGHPWTIANLANEVGLSRSALVERFTRYLSEPPMAYLTRWRLQVAARALSQSSQAVAEIGEQVGYESEAAFSRAFKRAFGLPPARYRKERRQMSNNRPKETEDKSDTPEMIISRLMQQSNAAGN